MEGIQSPITKKNNVSFLRKLKVSKVIKEYKNKFNIDVSNYFIGIKNISIYKCNDTEYEFYHPLNIMGDSSFYEYFQKFDWYYMSWKWEHEITIQYIKPNMKVLEIGCAHGAFLKRINKNFDLKKSVGLELNESAVMENEKILIKNENVQYFSNKNKNMFDLACSFQVLEHISNVNSFLTAKIDCLKKRGTLIISVPNNDSFVKDMGVGLNSPPHHMGLWNQKSLKALENIYPIKLVKIHFEELQEYHVGSYVESKYYSKYPLILKRIIRKFNKIVGLHDKQLKKIRREKNNLRGHTILAVFKKF